MSGLDLNVVAQRLAEAAANATGIVRAYPTIPEKIEGTPCAYVGFADPVRPNRRFGRGAVEAEIVVTAVVGRHDVTESQARLRALQSNVPLEGPGDPLGLIDALTQDRTLGGACGALFVRETRDVRGIDFAGTVYIACDFIVVVNA